MGIRLTLPKAFPFWVGAVSLIYDAVSDVLRESFSGQANRNLNSPDYEQGKRQARTLAQFDRFNAAIGLAGAGH
jgi:hypothetical protein